MAKSLSVDVRKVVSESVTVRVQMKNIWIVKVGLVFIRIGCFLSGAQFVKEFPMSLIQNGKPVDMDE